MQLRFFLFTIGCLTIGNLFSQTQKGDILISTNMAAMSYTNATGKYENDAGVLTTELKENKINFNISPSVAYFIKNNLAVGASLTIGYLNEKYKYTFYPTSNENSKNKNTSSFIYVGPMARYYFGNKGSGKPYIQTNLQFGFQNKTSKTTTENGIRIDSKLKYHGIWNSGINIGYEYLINQNIGIIAGFGIAYGKAKITEDIQYENPISPGVSPGLAERKATVSTLTLPLNIGLQIHLPKSK